jgi:hypothetical protein
LGFKGVALAKMAEFVITRCNGQTCYAVEYLTERRIEGRLGKELGRIVLSEEEVGLNIDQLKTKFSEWINELPGEVDSSESS